MKLGMEEKAKVFGLPREAGLTVLGLFMALALYLFYDNVLAGPSYTPQAPPAAKRNAADLDIATSSANAAAAKSNQPKPIVKRASKGDDFRPSMGKKKGARAEEDQVNPADIDPTIHWDLLAKVQNMKLEGGQRNLFQFGTAPAVEKLKGEEPIILAMGRPVVFPKPDPPKAAVVPPPPPPPPAPPTFKYYGLATKRIDNKKTAFFLDGEEIILAIEGMTVKGKWRVVRIGADSVMLEDTDSKKQQPLAISEEATSGPS